MSINVNNPNWASDQIDAYKKLREHFKTYASTLETILKEAVPRLAPHAITEARAKDIASFAEKIQQKKTKYRDPVNQLTDLCGARVTTYTEEEKQAVCRFVREYFVIDWANSEDEAHRLGEEKFGYRSTHFIVQFKPNVFPNGEVKTTVPPVLFPFPSQAPRNPMKAEIQVRTLLEHAWANFTHDRAYKGGFTPPPSLTRELNAVSAVLESADASFTRALTRLRLYGESYAYFSIDETRNEIALLHTALSAEPDVSKRAAVALRIARLGRCGRLWESVISTLDPCMAEFERENIGQLNALRLQLGYALARKHQMTWDGVEFRRGQHLLEMAAGLTRPKIPLPRLDFTPENQVAAEASAWLAWSHSHDPFKRQLVAALYLRALEGQPDNPYHLVDHLIYELASRREWSHLATMQGALLKAIDVCQEHIQVHVGRPQVYFTLGFLHLFLAKPRDLGDAQPRPAARRQRNDLYAGLSAIARGIQGSEDLEPIREALDAVKVLLASVAGVQGESNWESRMLEWTCRLLRCGELAKLHALAGASAAALSKAEQDLDDIAKALERGAHPADHASKLDELLQDREKAKKLVTKARQQSEQTNNDLQKAIGELRGDFLSEEFRSKTHEVQGVVLIVCGGTAEDVEDAMRGYKDTLQITLKSFTGTIFSGGTKAGIPGILGEIASQSARTDPFRLIAYLPNAKLGHAAEDERYDQPFIRTTDQDFSPAQPLQNWTDILSQGIRPGAVTILGINGGPLAEFEYRLGLGLGARTALLRNSGRAADDVLADEDLSGDSNRIAIPDLMTLQNFIAPPPKTEFRESLGKRIHEVYVDEQRSARLRKEPNLADWPDLPQSLKGSNFQQADAMASTLLTIGCEIVKTSDSANASADFTKDEVDSLAQMEHARWNAERLREGWRYASEKNVERKLSPYLVSWAELKEPVRDWDRTAVRAWPALLAELGFKIARRT